jgi:prepilin peptidase CpaA
MDEVRSFFELLGMLVTEPRTGVLLALLAAAAVSDYRTYRIPNLLTGGGIAFALVYNLVSPPWHADWTFGPAGMLLGFGAMLPLYALRALGAGDVKLMAMVGAFLGAGATVEALLFSIVTGGIAALAFSLRKRVTGSMLANTTTIMRGLLWSPISGANPQLRPDLTQSVGKLAYGISIAVGTTCYLVAQQFGLL